MMFHSRLNYEGRIGYKYVSPCSDSQMQMGVSHAKVDH